MKRYCFALDLKEDPTLIDEYEKFHQKIWPEITESIKSSGIIDLQIYRILNRLFMIMDAGDDFSLERKAEADSKNAKVEAWEKLMWKYQESLPGSAPGEKWRMMDLIFDLKING